MATPLIIPKKGQSVETCIITKWFRKQGDCVNKGDLLFSYETDKAAFDMESPADGIILEIIYHDRAEVPVLENVGFIGFAGEQIDPQLHIPSREEIKSGGINEPTRPVITDVKPSISMTSDNNDDINIRISPRAKRFAERNNLTYKNILGSGPNGRILCGDIEKALARHRKKPETVSEQPDEFSEIPVTNVRRIIARAMQTSLQNSAQLTHHMSADVRNILSIRNKIKEALKNGKYQQDITLNDMICFCVVRALRSYPEINSHFMGDRIFVFKKVHLGLAVDTPRGLMVPSIKNADEMDLGKLSYKLKSAADACRNGTINPDLLSSSAASFTVSNLGNYGVEMFTPIINLPQSAILGVCTILNRPADIGNNTLGFVPFIGLSLTYDHRSIDGGPATMFLKEIKDQIEKFKY
jgi:pyruvate dehydrogenase E2 component (dihydrolipoamide acetyltransferase)